MASHLVTAVKPEDVAAALAPHLTRNEADPRQVVLMMCGVAGAGKSTITRALLSKYPPGTFVRISNDEILAATHGIYGVDYPASLDIYEQYSTEANVIYDERLRALLSHGKQNIILDRSFYSKEDRDEFKKRIERAGARWVLVFLDVKREELWKRIQNRRAAEINADSALEITDDLFAMYWDGFDWPSGEGEIRVCSH